MEKRGKMKKNKIRSQKKWENKLSRNYQKS